MKFTIEIPQPAEELFCFYPSNTVTTDVAAWHWVCDDTAQEQMRAKKTSKTKPTK
jgi:hypothetical protein